MVIVPTRTAPFFRRLDQPHAPHGVKISIAAQAAEHENMHRDDGFRSKTAGTSTNQGKSVATCRCLPPATGGRGAWN
eukprot:scaffold12559_cov125-Isochrysis_galbana.AAC.11